MEALGDRAAVAIPKLLDGFEYWRLSPDFGIHHRILRILGNHGPAARQAVPLLERALADHDLESRRLAAEALEKIRVP